jgi:hypothetical protein
VPNLRPAPGRLRSPTSTISSALSKRLSRTRSACVSDALRAASSCRSLAARFPSSKARTRSPLGARATRNAGSTRLGRSTRYQHASAPTTYHPFDSSHCHTFAATNAGVSPSAKPSMTPRFKVRPTSPFPRHAPPLARVKVRSMRSNGTRPETFQLEVIGKGETTIVDRAGGLQ